MSKKTESCFTGVHISTIIGPKTELKLQSPKNLQQCFVVKIWFAQTMDLRWVWIRLTFWAGKKLLQLARILRSHFSFLHTHSFQYVLHVWIMFWQFDQRNDIQKFGLSDSFMRLQSVCRPFIFTIKGRQFSFCRLTFCSASTLSNFCDSRTGSLDSVYCSLCNG